MPTRSGNLSGGFAKLQGAVDDLQRAWVDIKDHWDDDQSRNFEETQLIPISQSVKAALEATTQLNDVLAQARRDCNP